MRRRREMRNTAPASTPRRSPAPGLSAPCCAEHSAFVTNSGAVPPGLAETCRSQAPKRCPQTAEEGGSGGKPQRGRPVASQPVGCGHSRASRKSMSQRRTARGGAGAWPGWQLAAVAGRPSLADAPGSPAPSRPPAHCEDPETGSGRPGGPGPVCQEEGGQVRRQAGSALEQAVAGGSGGRAAAGGACSLSVTHHAVVEHGVVLAPHTHDACHNWTQTQHGG